MDTPTPNNEQLVRRMRLKADGHPYGRTDYLLREAADALEVAEAKLARVREAAEVRRYSRDDTAAVETAIAIDIALDE